MMTTTLTVPAPDRQKNASAPAAPIDAKALLSRCMGNVSFAFALLGELEATGKQLVDGVVLHAASDKPHATAEAAHSLKGTAAIIGDEPLFEKAAEIEVAVRAGETSLLLDMAHDLRSEMDRCLAYIPTLRIEIERLAR